MQIIDVDNLDLKKLSIISEPCNMATVYTDYETVYKIYSQENVEYGLKSLKIDLLSSILMTGLVLPKQKIVGKDSIGYTMDYVTGLHIPNLKLTNAELLQLFKNISNLLKYYHKYGIILADLNISNIIVKSLDEIYFCDVDSCKIANLPHDNIPFLTKYYLDKLNIKSLEVDENFDRLSLYLLFLYLIFDKKSILTLSKHEVDKTLEEKGLDKQRTFVRNFKNNLNNVPYLEELI